VVKQFTSGNLNGHVQRAVNVGCSGRSRQKYCIQVSAVCSWLRICRDGPKYGQFLWAIVNDIEKVDGVLYSSRWQDSLITTMAVSRKQAISKDKAWTARLKDNLCRAGVTQRQHGQAGSRRDSSKPNDTTEIGCLALDDAAVAVPAIQCQTLI